MLLNKMKQEKEQGQALVEFALTLPILLMLTFGIIDLARLLFAYTNAVDAARQGVRYGIVTGLSASQQQYLDCQGIADAVRDLPGITNPADMSIAISYEDALTNAKITDCVPGLTWWDVGNGDVLVVDVSGSITPMTPVLLMFTNSLPYNYTARRTIMSQGAAYTDEWPEPPPQAANFTATVDCSLVNNNVSFAWSPMSPIPDRAEIRNSITGDTVVVLNDTEPGLITNAYCNNCATIDTADGWAMYYLVAVNGNSPSEMAGPPSQDAVVLCNGGGTGPGPGNGTGEISGKVYYDKNSNMVVDNGEQGIKDVKVELYDAGPDGSLGTSDDLPPFQVLTDNKGEFVFSGLSVPTGLSLQTFRVTVVQSSTALGGKLLTTANNPTDVYLAEGQSFGGILFGFDD